MRFTFDILGYNLKNELWVKIVIMAIQSIFVTSPY